MRNAVRSPLQVDTRSPLFLVKLAADLLKVHTQFVSKIETFIHESRTTKEEVVRIRSFVEGLRQPKDGETPVIDYDEVASRAAALVQVPSDGKDGINGIDGEDGESPDPFLVAEIAAGLIVRPKDGKDSPSLEAIVQAVITALQETDALEVEKRMVGIRNEVASYRSQLAGKIYGKDTWARGGGSSSTSSSTPLTPTGTVNAVNTVFGVASRPSSVVSDGITYFEGAGYAYAGLVITLDIPPSSYIRYYA